MRKLLHFMVNCGIMNKAIRYTIYQKETAMNIEIERLNIGVQEDPSGYIESCNLIYQDRITEIAQKIAENRQQRPIILLAGPSGSGKTTTALTIGKTLSDMGVITHTLSMDNYFCSLKPDEKILAAQGKIDLETPRRINAELLNEHLEAIGKCQPIELPRYDFRESESVPSGTVFRRKEGEIVIFEGIHALNPSVIKLPDDKLSNIYVSVRTRVTCGNIVLHPSKIRLMRRMVRDRNFRSRTLYETLNMFKSVEEGENKYITPYKYRSNFDVDTFIPYELNAYCHELRDDLMQMTDKPELDDLRAILGSLRPLSPSLITPDSLICEFFGGGQFMY